MKAKLVSKHISSSSLLTRSSTSLSGILLPKIFEASHPHLHFRPLYTSQRITTTPSRTSPFKPSSVPLQRPTAIPSPQHTRANMSSSTSPVPNEDPCAEQCTKPTDAPKPKTTTEQKPDLPPLSPSDFRTYNHLADRMELFHNHFRQSWTLLYEAAKANKRPSNMTLRQFMDVGIQLCRHLTAHHDIEETYFYPILAKRMPDFRPGRNTLLIQQHREIHVGMDAFEEYLLDCRAGKEDFSMRGLKEKMDSWGEVLWVHLDDEVRTLGAENMRRYWSLEEIRAIHV